MLVQPLRAQQPRLSAKELGQIVSEVLRIVVPPTDSASKVSIADRKVVFEYARTMKAFQVDSLLRATLAVKDAPREGSMERVRLRRTAFVFCRHRKSARKCVVGSPSLRGVRGGKSAR